MQTHRRILPNMALSLLAFSSGASPTAVYASQTEPKPVVGSRSFEFKENDNHVISLQADQTANVETAGRVTIDYFGHMAFRITSPKGLTIVIDPWRNDPTATFGVWFPKDFPEIPADIALSSHAHFDHDALYRVHATMNLERMAGTFILGDVRITGIADKHQCKAPGDVNWSMQLHDKLNINNLCPPDNGMSWDNSFYVIETGGLRIGFWGDNRPNPGPLMREALKGLDVLIMNVDGSQHILSYKQIDEILATYRPKMVIPGHYLSPGVVDASSSLKSADAWVQKASHKKLLDDSRLVVTPSLVRGLAVSTVYYFGAHVAEK